MAHGTSTPKDPMGVHLAHAALSSCSQILPRMPQPPRSFYKYILRDPRATGQCSYCQMDSTNQFLERINVDWDTRWRDFGLMWVYIAFNVAAAVSLYWLCRVPKGKKKV
jgi:ABC-type multidrug transport system permease subunit